VYTYPCRTFSLLSSIEYPIPIRYDGTLDYNTTLSNRTFTFKIPAYINVTKGNSGDAGHTTTLTFTKISNKSNITTSGTIVNCIYVGSGYLGVTPIYPNETAAAQTYNWMNCSDTQLKIDSKVNVTQVDVRINEGGDSNPGAITTVNATLIESSGCDSTIIVAQNICTPITTTTTITTVMPTSTEPLLPPILGSKFPVFLKIVLNAL